MDSVSCSVVERASFPPGPVGVSSLLGESAAMQQIYRLIDRVGPTNASVLLTGEGGSGKELAARCVHERSPRRNKPFVLINCGAIPAALIEAELFGCEDSADGKGPDGRGRAGAGAFERADGGTLLLDEITELPMDMQTRLLRVLESRKFYRIGAAAEHSSDVRVIAATNRCPLTAVKSGLLRQDLLYRLAAFPIEVPPLRSRGEDVELLAERFLAELNADAGTQKRFSALARITLRRHTWPGNVRELKSCVERAFILGDDILEVAPLTHSSSGHAQEEQAGDTDAATDRGRLDIRVGSRIHDMERSLIEATLEYFKGNKRRAADALGCSLKTLYNKLNGYSHSQECASS